VQELSLASSSVPRPSESAGATVVPSTRRTAIAALGALLSASLDDRPARAQAIYAESAIARGIDYHVAQGAFGGSGQFGCGVALVDLDGDGDDDVVCLGASDERLGFFRNDGIGHFTNVSAATGLGAISRASGIAAGDYDADGDLDLAVTRWLKPTALLRNDGNMTFVDVANASGIVGAGAGAGCAWGDYDGDGWIDLAVANRAQTLFNYTRCKLWRNNGDGTFTERATALGVDNGIFPAFMVSWCDLDRDGDLDLYVGNDKGRHSPFWNRLYRNNGDGTFYEHFTSGAQVAADAMGTAFGDVDHDGVPEIYVSNVPFANHLLRSADGGHSFADVADAAGVAGVGSCWGAAFIDPANDGRIDLFVLSQNTDNFLFVQGPQWPLVEAAEFWGLSNTATSYCLAVGDVDRDGDEDLLVQDHLAKIKLYVNGLAHGPQRRWIDFRVVGRGANTHGIGTRVETLAGGRLHWREVAAGSGYKSQSAYRLHVGLGAVTSVDQVTVTFPRAGVHPAATRVLTGLPFGVEWPLYPPERVGDHDGDGVRSDVDRTQVAKRVGSACTPETAVLDVDGDSAVTEADLLAFDLVQCDLDGDSVVGARDLAMLLAGWGSTRADFDADGSTGVGDLARLLGSWSR